MKNRKQTTAILASAILMLGIICRSVPVEAATSKIIVNDVDEDGSISIGDTFCLGEECFNILENKDGSVSALAKYNLMTGYNIHYYAADSELSGFFDDGSRDYFDFLNDNNYFYCESFNDPSTNSDAYFCYEPVSLDLNWQYLAGIPEYTDLVGYDTYAEVAKQFTYCKTNYEYLGSWHYSLLYCFTVSRNDVKVAQSPLAVSAHGDARGQLEYPEIGDHFFNRNLTNYLYKYDSLNTGDENMYYDENNELIRDTYMEKYGYDTGWGEDLRMNYIYEPIYEYQENLKGAGYPVQSVDLLSYNRLADFLTAVNDKYMTFAHNGYGCDNWTGSDEEGWACDTSPWVWRYETRAGLYYGYSSMVDYVPEQYNWIYSTSYWLKTGFWNTFEERYTDSNYQFFVDSLGDLCFVTNRSTCDTTSIGAGIRPVITVSLDDIEINSMTIAGKIIWKDNNNALGARPQKAVLKLRRNGEIVKEIEVTDGNDEIWEFTFGDMPKYDENGDEYVYEIVQDDIARYVSDVTDFEIVNEYVENPSTFAENPWFYGGIIGVIGMVGAVALRRSRR